MHLHRILFLSRVWYAHFRFGNELERILATHVDKLIAPALSYARLVRYQQVEGKSKQFSSYIRIFFWLAWLFIPMYVCIHYRFILSFVGHTVPPLFLSLTLSVAKFIISRYLPPTSCLSPCLSSYFSPCWLTEWFTNILLLWICGPGRWYCFFSLSLPLFHLNLFPPRAGRRLSNNCKHWKYENGQIVDRMFFLP